MEQVKPTHSTPLGYEPDGRAEPTPALASLSLLQRILLTTDGTVGRILEQYTGESIEVVKLEQSFEPAQTGQVELGLSDPEVGFPGPEQVLVRRVILRGRRSGRNLIYAESMFRTDKLPTGVLERLLSTTVSIGQLLYEQRLETFREILTSGQEPAGPSCEYFGLEPSDMLLFRTYRIFLSSHPVVMITERFPVQGALSAPA